MVSEIIQLCRGNALLERDKTCSSLYAGHSHHHVDPRVTVHPQRKKQGYTLTQACFRRCRLCPILLFNQHREECHAQLSFLSMSSLFLRLFTSFAADAGPLNHVAYWVMWNQTITTRSLCKVTNKPSLTRKATKTAFLGESLYTWSYSLRSALMIFVIACFSLAQLGFKIHKGTFESVASKTLVYKTTEGNWLLFYNLHSQVSFSITFTQPSLLILLTFPKSSTNSPPREDVTI